jgi:metallo-beta-lactamase family protein
MRIQFSGADRTVTGSCHLLEINGARVLLDCGMYQGKRDVAREMNQALPDDPKNIDAVILSHGHLDHCGKLPVLLRAGYAGPIYCTPATAEVARIVLLDAAKIQEENADYLNRRCREPGDCQVDPLFKNVDVHDVLKSFRRVSYGQQTTIAGRNGAGLAFTFFDAGHILGSAYVKVEFSEKNEARSLLFTADVGRYGSPILRDPQALSAPVDFVITESTYGNKSHGPISAVEPALLDAVQDCIAKHGRMLVPSFAVGRTQTILWYIQKFISERKIPAIPLYVDSPMGVEVSKVHSEFRDQYDQETTGMIGENDLFGLARVTFASSTDQSKQINRDRGPCVIVASSPTCEFGRILHHLTVSVENPNDMVVFVGWIPPQTLGRRLQDGQARVRILDRWYDVRCQVRTIHGLSAHADAEELVRFLSPTLVKTTTAFVVHGEEDQAEGFARRLLEHGIGRAAVPAIRTSVITASDGLPAPVVTPDDRGSKASSDGD